MEVYVNNDYEDPDNPNELLTAREKEIQYVAVGFISMLDENGVRVTTVPINIDATDPNFMGKLYAETVTGNRERLHQFETLKVPAFPGGRTLRAPLLFLALSWYAMMDRI